MGVLMNCRRFVFSVLSKSAHESTKIDNTKSSRNEKNAWPLHRGQLVPLKRISLTGA